MKKRKVETSNKIGIQDGYELRNIVTKYRKLFDQSEIDIEKITKRLIDDLKNSKLSKDDNAPFDFYPIVKTMYKYWQKLLQEEVPVVIFIF